MSASGNENQLSKNPAVTAQNGGNNNPRTPPFGTSQRSSFRCSPKAMRPLGMKMGFDSTRIESKRPDWNTTFKLVGNNTQSNKESGFEPTESNHRPESCNLSKSHE